MTEVSQRCKRRVYDLERRAGAVGQPDLWESAELYLVNIIIACKLQCNTILYRDSQKSRLFLMALS